MWDHLINFYFASVHFRNSPTMNLLKINNEKVNRERKNKIKWKHPNTELQCGSPWRSLCQTFQGRSGKTDPIVRCLKKVRSLIKGSSAHFITDNSSESLTHDRVRWTLQERPPGVPEWLSILVFDNGVVSCFSLPAMLQRTFWYPWLWVFLG